MTGAEAETATAEHHQHPHLPHLSSSTQHHHHIKTVAERADPQEEVNEADSATSSRSSSSQDDTPEQTISNGNAANGDASKNASDSSIAYDIKLSCRSEDPLADLQALSPSELPSHWVPTMVSQVNRVASSAFDQLASAAHTPRQSSSANRSPSNQPPERERRESEESENHLHRLMFQNPWEKTFRKPGVKTLFVHRGLKWGLPDTYTEGSGKKGVRASGFKSDKKIRKQIQEAKQQDKELGEGWDEVNVQEPDWGWPKDRLEKEVDGLRKEESRERPEQERRQRERSTTGYSNYKQEERPLQDYKDPTNHSRVAARVTWLGHATTLLQLPSLTENGEEDLSSRSINILFDPIFSERCSPSQSAGPQRFTPAPCKEEHLPPIDFVIISHSHYDHLDYHTFKHLRKLRGEKIHAIVPLGVKDKLTGSGGFGWEKEQVSELDWWDDATLTLPGRGGKGAKVRVICTPAQHGSGRGAGDKDCSLWASWVLEWTKGDSRFCTFFAGDTGLKYHHDNPHKRYKYPPCPAFADIAAKFQPFDLLLLPISVGSSLSYFRSWDPFPRAISPFPRVSSALTSSIHMDPYDAVECHGIFEKERKDGGKGMVSLAVHYGTFVRNEEQTKGDVRELRRACRLQGLKFRRVRDEACLLKASEEDRLEGGEGREKDMFLVADQGKTLWLPIHSSS